MKRLHWLKRPEWRIPGRVRRRTSSQHALSTRELLLVAAVLLVPIPLFAMSGLRLPLLGAVERGVASLLPGGWEETATGGLVPASDSVSLVDDDLSGAEGPSEDEQTENGSGEGAAPGGVSDQPGSPSGGAENDAPSGDPQAEPAGGSSSSSNSDASAPTSKPPNSGGGGGGGSGGGSGGSGSGGKEPDATTNVSVGLPVIGGVTVSGGASGSDGTPEGGGSVSVDTPLEGGDATVTQGAAVPDAENPVGGLIAGAASSSDVTTILEALPLNLPLPISLP